MPLQEGVSDQRSRPPLGAYGLPERFLSKVRINPETGCWEWQARRDRDGYGKYQLDGRPACAHHVSFEADQGPRGGCVVRHTCDNPPCVNPEHLIRGTHADNMRDMVLRGRSAAGSRHARAKLTEEDVMEARRLNAEGVGYRRLAALFGVHRVTIGRAVKGELWAHV